MPPASSAESPRPAGSRSVFVAAALLLAVAILAGGGSSRFPFTELIVELAAAAALVPVLIAWRWRAIDPGFRPPIMLAVAMLALILVQITPLPPAIWTGLPGRALATDTIRALDGSPGWRPLSLDPEATVRSLLALLPGIAMLMATALLPPRARIDLVRLTVALTAVLLVVGLVQLISGGQHFYLYSAEGGSSHRGVPTALFVNRNHFAALLLVAIVACGALARAGTMRMLPPLLAAAFAAMVLATASRTGTVLLPLAILAALLLARRTVDRRGWVISVALMGCAAILLTIALFHAPGGALDRLVARFGQDEDSRFEFWPVALSVARDWLPWGSGIGAFDMAFRAGEPLAIVGSHFVNHAHNDYLEIAIEAGLPGLILVAASLWWMARSGWRAWRDPIRCDADLHARMAIAAATLILLHSIVDYPLRTLAVETIFGLLVGIIAAGGNNFKASKAEKA